MDWRQAMAFGAAGGAIVEVISLWGSLAGWQQARKGARRRGTPLPSWQRYFDPWSDVPVACNRLLLGALAGWVFHGQVTGETAALAVGAAAPVLLDQLVSARNVRALVQHGAGGVEATDFARIAPGTGDFELPVISAGPIEPTTPVRPGTTAVGGPTIASDGTEPPR